MDATAKKEVSNAVLAPVVVDAKTEEGVRAFLSYVDTLTRHSNTEIAEAEAHRLEPYFGAMSEYVREALQKPPPAQTKPGDKMPNGMIYVGTSPDKGNAMYVRLGSTSPQALSTAWDSPTATVATPGALSDLFNAMAQTTHATLISDVVIVPSDIRLGPASELFKDHREFTAPYNYLGHRFEFGFLQAYEGGRERGAKSSTTFSVFTVDHRMIDALPPGDAAPLLRSLQSALTVVNHDMLHHFTSAMINPNTVHHNAKSAKNGCPLSALVQRTRPVPGFKGHDERATPARP